jgi:hypothetical protein
MVPAKVRVLLSSALFRSGAQELREHWPLVQSPIFTEKWRPASGLFFEGGAIDCEAKPAWTSGESLYAISEELQCGARSSGINAFQHIIKVARHS